MVENSSVDGTKTIPDPTDDNLCPAAMLRKMRCKNNLTQKELAKALNISLPMLSDLENSKKPIDAQMAQKLAEILDCDDRFFLGACQNAGNTDYENRLYYAWIEKCRMPGLRKSVSDSDFTLSESALQELELNTRNAVVTHCKKRKPLRPAHLEKMMVVLAKHLKKSAESLDRCGETGEIFMLSVRHTNGYEETFSSEFHIEYLSWLAKRAAKAAEPAQKDSKSRCDNLGGPTPDYRLRNLIVSLINRFEDQFGRKAWYTYNADSGERDSIFDLYVKEALNLFHPDGAIYENGRIDEIIKQQLHKREGTEPFGDDDYECVWPDDMPTKAHPPAPMNEEK